MNDFPTLKRLFSSRITPGEARATDIAASVDELGNNLSSGTDIGRVQVRMLGDKRSTDFSLEVLAGDAKTSKATIDNADLEIVVSEETWTEIANGDLSPVDAYLTGRMEIAGDLSFGKRLYAKGMSGRRPIDDLPI